MKKIAYIASECVPFVKTGGLADVVGTLPRIFDKKEYDVRVIMPNYMCLPAKFKRIDEAPLVARTAERTCR